jgi:hypothetical protein
MTKMKNIRFILSFEPLMASLAILDLLWGMKAVSPAMAPAVSTLTNQERIHQTSVSGPSGPLPPAQERRYVPLATKVKRGSIGREVFMIWKILAARIAIGLMRIGIR